MNEMKQRGYNPNHKWYNETYRGKNCDKWSLNKWHQPRKSHNNDKIYPEYNQKYLAECINNLLSKGVVCKYMKGVIN
jgi:uncharacterized protein (TIGR02328 family)